MRPILWSLLLVLVIWPSPAPATTITASDTDDDATLFLAVEDTLYPPNPSPDWCEVRITVWGDDVLLTAGDSIYVWVYEDDVVNDDLVFEVGYEVSVSEASAQHVDRTWDCSVGTEIFLGEVGQFAEIYAEAVVMKDECGTFCAWDRPQTANLDVAIIDGATSSPAVRTAWLGDAHPNPFNPATTISYSIPHGMGSQVPGELVIYDLSGRRVRMLVSGTLYPGTNSVTWNGTDEAGARMASGVYLYQLRVGEYVETKRMVLLK